MVDKGAVITIDGPSGAGKSTISKMLAAKLNYTYLDTGAMYRAVGLKVDRAGLDLDSEAGRDSLPGLLAETELTLEPAPEGSEFVRVFLDGKEVTGLIRTPDIAMIASRTSAEPVVRAKLTEMQRQIGSRGSVVAEGRDTGTVVFPTAEHKFYLDASAEERCRRRCEQLRAQGQEVDDRDILAQIIKRDADDSSRSLAPLTPAVDAVIVDSSSMNIDEVIAFMLAKIEGK